MTITIVPQLVGGIGNRLFQLAAAHHVALATRSQLAVSGQFAAINAHGHDPENNWYFRHVARLSAEYDAVVVTISEQWGESPEDLVRRVERVIEGFASTQNLSVVLQGYFQNEAFFAQPTQAATIREWFTWPGTIDEMNGSESVRYAVHVRRSDYVNNKYHEILTCDDQLHAYYREAAEHFPKDAPYGVFSDDIEWCRSKFEEDERLIKSAHFVSADLGPFQSLQLMSRCALGTVVANSSFSWWAAWLNKNPEKIVTMPSRWFGAEAKIEESHFYSLMSYQPVIVDV